METTLALSIRPELDQHRVGGRRLDGALVAVERPPASVLGADRQEVAAAQLDDVTAQVQCAAVVARLRER